MSQDLSREWSRELRCHIIREIEFNLSLIISEDENAEFRSRLNFPRYLLAPQRSNLSLANQIPSLSSCSESI
jgi:hypothetical protein